MATVRRLADRDGRNPDDVARQAVKAAAEREVETQRRRSAIAELQREYASWPATGLKADKAFFDDLGGGL